MLSVAPSSSTLLPQPPHGASPQEPRLSSQSFTRKSPVPVSKPLIVLAAGSVSILLVMAGCVCIVCFKKRRRGRMIVIARSKVKKKKLHRRSGNLRCLNGLDATDTEPPIRIELFKSPWYAAKFPFMSPSSPHSEQWSMSSSLPILDHHGPTASPWSTCANLAPKFVSSFSFPHTGTLHEGIPSFLSKQELEVNESGSIDIGTVILKDFDSPERNILTEYYTNTVSSQSSDSVLEKGDLPHSSVDLTDGQYLDEEVDSSRGLDAMVPSPIDLISDFLGQQDGDSVILQSPSLNSDGAAGESVLNAPDIPPRLLELRLLGSEDDLRACLGLKNKASVDFSGPQGLGTKSPQDASFSHETVMEILSRHPDDDIISRGVRPQSQSGRETCCDRTSTFPSSRSTRASFYAKMEPLNKSLSLSPTVTGLSCLHVGANSLSTPSNSITTLKLPSFRSAGPALLTKEVLPPPSIIVSMPTDPSIVSEDSLHICLGESGRRQKRRGSGIEKEGRRIAPVVYDPADESEDDAWSTGARFSQKAKSIAAEDAEVTDFRTSWILSSESSELYLRETVAKFPLPPNYSANSTQMVQ